MWTISELKIYSGNCLSKYAIRRDKDVWRVENQEKLIVVRKTLQEAKDYVSLLIASFTFKAVRTRWYVHKIINKERQASIQRLASNETMFGKKKNWYAIKSEGHKRSWSKSFGTLKEAKSFCEYVTLGSTLPMHLL